MLETTIFLSQRLVDWFRQAPKGRNIERIIGLAPNISWIKMGRKGVSVCLVMALLLGSIVVLDVTMDITPRVEAITIYVDDDYGSEDPTHKMTIQAAVDAANDGDTVYVYPGIYYENVIVDKTINLTGENKLSVVIEGKGNNCLTIYSNYVNVSGFTFNNGSSGVDLDNTNYCFINNNRMTNNTYGLSITGIYNSISNNTIENSSACGYEITDYNNYIEQSNKVNGEIIYYFFNVHGIKTNPIVVENLNLQKPRISNQGKINLVNCSHIIIQNSSFSNNTGGPEGKGVFIYESNNITVYNNTIYDNDMGIGMRFSNNITILKNIISNISYRGIRLLQSSNNNQISNNTLEDNNAGIGISFSHYNVIFNNSIHSDGWSLDIFSGSSYNTVTFNNISGRNDFDGIYIDGGIGNYLEGNDVYTDIGNGIQIRNVGFIKIVNTSINPGAYSFYLLNNDWVYSINNSFNKSSIYMGGNTNFTVQWYLHVNVTNSIGKPVSNATVTVVDSYKSLPVNKYQTDSSGYARWIVGTEYIQTSSGKTYYTPHRITAWNETHMGYIEVNINESKELNIILDTPYYEIPLSAGWNLISLPLVQSDTSISTVLSSIAGNWDVVWWYNASGGKWHSTNDDLTDINHTMGFWIHMKTADTLIVTGNIPNTTSIQLFQGWNLVGNPSFCIHGIDDILSPIATKYTAVQQYYSWDNGDPWKHYHINKPQNLNDLAYMTSGRGYWLYVNEDCVWEVSNF